MLEIIGSSLKQCIDIEKYGGERIELVSALHLGGLTPSYGLVKEVLKHVNIPIVVMLRTHNHGFKYNAEDLLTMKEDAIMFEKLGVKRVVFGALDDNGMPDMSAVEYVLGSTNLDMVFHRAIDSSRDPVEALKIIQQNPRITHVLTSGGTSENRLAVLKEMKKIATLKIVVGKSITAANARLFLDELNDVDIHIGTYALKDSDLEEDIDPKRMEKILEAIKKD